MSGARFIQSKLLIAKIFLLSLLFSQPAWCLLGVGNYVTDSGLYQKNYKAERQTFEFAPYFSAHYRWQFASRFEFVPEIAFAFHKRPSPNHSRMTIMLLYPVTWRMWPSHFLVGGIGNIITRIAGKGGSVIMNNGNGISIFSRPSGASYSPTMATFLGYEYRFRDYLSVRATAFLVPVFAKPPRLSYSVSTNLYYF